MNGRRLFRALLRVLPFDFRTDYGRDIEQTFETQRREAPDAIGRAHVWAGTVAAIFSIGPREHLVQLRQDLTYATRGMRRNPGFVLVAGLTLALGTGVNTAIFSIVHAVLLKPLPYGDEQTLMTVMNRWDGSEQSALSDPEYLDYAEQSRTMDIAAMARGRATLSGGNGEPQQASVVSVTANAFRVLGRQPALGRGFGPDDERRGSAVVIISDAVWKERFGGDPSIVGRTINVQGSPQTIVGVLPPDLVLPLNLVGSEPADLLLPLRFDRAAPRNSRGAHYMTGVARLKPGATQASAAAEMDGILARLAAQYPEEHDQGNFAITVRPLRETFLGESRPVLWMLGGAVALVLLLACANVANLMMARGEGRRRELSVRAALGASRFRMARQLMTEALLLSLGATILGLLIAKWALRLVLAASPDALPRLTDVSLDTTVLAFAAVLAIGTTLIFGMVPAWQMSRADAGDALKDGARGGSTGARARVRRALVVCQVALAVVLLVGAGLLLKSFGRLLSVPGGFDPDQVLTAQVSAQPTRYPGLPEVTTFYERLLEGVRSAPGVEAAGASTGLPLAVASGDWGFDIEGRPRVNGRRPGAADWYAVTPGYFEALRIPTISGRGPRSSDTGESNRVIFINQTTAKTLFPGEDPLGKRIQLSQSRGLEQPWRTITGVIADVRQRGLDEPVRPEIYIPHPQFQHFVANQQARSMTLVVRGALPPEQLVSSVRAALRNVDPEIPLANVRPMTEVIARSVASRKLNVLIIGAFALLAIVLASVGVYGVMANDVFQRTREIGIRVALGASRGTVLRLILRQGMTLVLIGAAIGLTAAALLTGSFARLLFEVTPRDLAVFAGVAALLAATGAVASYIPAWRATRLNPLTALRAE